MEDLCSPASGSLNEARISSGSVRGDTETRITHARPTRHRLLWFDDGNLQIFSKNYEVMFRVHRSFVERFSRKSLVMEEKEFEKNVEAAAGIQLDSNIHAVLWNEYHGQSIELILGHIYHTRPITSRSSFSDLGLLIEATCPDALDFPSIYGISVDMLCEMYPVQPIPSEYERWKHSKEAAELCLKFRLNKPLKSLLYALVVSSDLELENNDHMEHRDPDPIAAFQQGETSTSKWKDPELAADVSRRCMHAMREMLAHFTPFLFTPPPTPHMECTDELASVWMTHILQPLAYERNGIYKPLETLHAMANDVIWSDVGICRSCLQLKRAEWKEESDVIWKKLDDWFGLPI